MGLWLRGLYAAVVSGFAGGISTGLATIGISPEHFNMQDPTLLFKVSLASAAISAVLGVSAYLKQSPLPPAE